MESEALYEKLRVILNQGSVIPFPKTEATFRLLTHMFDEGEAEIVVSGLKKVRIPVKVNDIADSVQMAETGLKEMLDKMVYMGLIARAPSGSYMALPYYPGIQPNFSVYQRADENSMKEISMAHSELMELSWVWELGDRDMSNFRVLPAIKPIEKTIAINQAIEAQHTIGPGVGPRQPFEMLSK